MENQRIRLSKVMLKNALLKLLEEKPLNQISILELCGEAQINRTTFYKYYGSQMDLLKEIESDFFAQLDREIRDVMEREPNALLLVLNYLYDQRKTFCVLVRAIPSREFTEQLFHVPAVGKIFQGMADASRYSQMEARYIRQFVLQGTFAVLCDWLGSDVPDPPAKIAEVLNMLKDRL